MSNYPNYAYPPLPLSAQPPYAAAAQQSLQYGQRPQIPMPGMPGNPVSVPPPPPPGPQQPQQLQHSNSFGSVSSLRVKLSEDLRIGPPVPVPAALIPASNTASTSLPDLELEKQVIESAATSDIEQFLSQLEPKHVLSSTVRECVDTGITREAAALAQAYCTANRLNPDKVYDFASNYAQLTIEMGLSPILAAGALVKHQNDATAAVNTLMP